MNNKKDLFSNDFDKWAEKWDKFKFIYLPVYEICFDFIEENFSEFSNVLDVGCGTGNFLNFIQNKRKKGSFFGIDNNLKMIKIAENKFPEIKFLKGNAEQPPFKKEHFDLITTIDSFYYFKNKDNFFNQASKLLKKNGCLFINTPQKEHFISRLLLMLIKLSRTERKSNHIFLKEILEKAKQNSFNLVESKAIKWPKTPLKYWLIIFKKTD